LGSFFASAARFLRDRFSVKGVKGSTGFCLLFTTLFKAFSSESETIEREIPYATPFHCVKISLTVTIIYLFQPLEAYRTGITLRGFFRVHFLPDHFLTACRQAGLGLLATLWGALGGGLAGQLSNQSTEVDGYDHFAPYSVLFYKILLKYNI
jgi:hypothetical protein